MDQIRLFNEKNAFEKHLEIHHPEQQGNIDAFKFGLEGIYKLLVVRQVTDSVYIHSNNAGTVMNSKSEWTQPMQETVIVTRKLDELEARDGARKRGRRRARRTICAGIG